MPASPSFCTGSEIMCSTEADCPLYRPLSAAGQPSSWSCEAGKCTYPGLDYVLGTP
jgi:hypothetical protein